MESDSTVSDQKPAERPAHWFRPGQSGNPAGRPPGNSALTVLRGILDQQDPDNEKQTKLEAFWIRVLKDAMAGEAAAQRLIADRIAPLKLILEGSEDGAPIVRVFSSKPEPGVIDVEGTREEK